MGLTCEAGLRSDGRVVPICCFAAPPQELEAMKMLQSLSSRIAAEEVPSSEAPEEDDFEAQLQVRSLPVPSIRSPPYPTLYPSPSARSTP